MFKASIDTSRIAVTNDDNEMLVSGSVNVNFIKFSFSEDWAGLRKTVIFQTKKTSLPIILDDETRILPIPWETLAYAGETINVGAYGTRVDDLETEEDETIILPTVWGTIGKVVQGVLLPNVPGPYPTPDAYYQLLKLLEDLIENGGVGGGGAGTYNHDLLKNRDLPEQHPIAAITGLQEALETNVVNDQTLMTAIEEIRRYLDTIVIPDVSDLATKTEVEAVKESIPDISGLATNEELNIIKESIPDVSNLVTDEDLKEAIDAIPTPEPGIAFTTDESLEFNDQNVLSVSTPVKDILTREEYDALTEEEKVKGMYIIDEGVSGGGNTGGSGNSGAGMDVYSTEETIIGKWIDGKTLYKKSYAVTSPSSVSSTTSRIADLPQDVDLVTNLYGILVTSAGWLSLNIYSITLLAQNVDSTIRMKVSENNQTDRPVYLTIEYTKKEAQS